MKTKRTAAWLTMSMVLLSACSGGGASQALQEKPVYQKISPEEALTMLQEQDVTLLDVRTQEEFAQAHIEGALLLPDFEIEQKAHELLPDQEKTILVYCRSGRRSQGAAQKLIEMGYTQVYDFGGIIDWPYETVSGQ